MIVHKPKHAGLTDGVFVEKRWGHERIFINGAGESTDKLNSYCMKEIFIRKNNCTSEHVHVNKHETLYVVSGILTFCYRDGEGSDPLQKLVAPGQAVVVPPGLIHRLCAWDTTEDVLIIEASTPDSPDDSIRVTM